MFRKLVVMLATVLAAGVGLAPLAAAYTPREGALFNDPYGRFSGELRLMSHVDQTILSTRRGETILISTYLLDRGQTVNKLIAASDRGVSVRVVMDKGIDSSSSRRLIDALNRDNPRRRQSEATGDPSTWGPDRSFAKKCIDSCRGGGGNNHSKFYAFSRAGNTSDIVMVSSANLNAGGAFKGYNDLFTMTNKPRNYDKYVDIHNQMANDTPNNDTYDIFRVGRFENRFFPMRNATRATDPVLDDLSRVRCRGATGGAGDNGRTTLHVSMFSWADQRGMDIARRLLRLQQEGCAVSIIYGAPSNEVAALLRQAAHRGRIKLYDSRVHTDNDGKVDIRVHSKYLLISGNYRGNSAARQVYSGSQNWTNGALTRADEIMLGIRGRSAHATYLHNWHDIRRTGTRRIGG